MSELRNLTRKHTDAFIGVYDSLTDHLVGCLVDMTSEGLQLRCIKEIETGSTFKFKMELPFQIKGGIELTFEAESVWCRKNEESDEFIAGFKIHAVSQNDIKRIEFLINSEIFADSVERMHVTLHKV